MRKLVKFACGPLLLAALVFAALSPQAISAAPSGSHVQITVQATPQQPVAGEDTRFVITLKANDPRATANAQVLIAAEMVMSGGMPGMSHGSAAITATAKATDKPGEYLATLKLPNEGEWKITAVSGDSATTAKVTAIKPQANRPAAVASAPGPAGVGATATQGSSAAQGAAPTTTSSMEAIHASYLDLSGNIADLRSRVAEWQKGDQNSLKIAEEKLQRTQVVLSSVAWPQEMATAIAKTKAAVEPMAKAIKDQNVPAAETAAKALGDASHDVTHAFYPDWLPTLTGARFTPMAAHVIYLDLSANIADLQSRVDAWQKGDESGLTIAKEKADRTGILLPHMIATGILIQPAKAIEKSLPAVTAALEKKDVAATQLALKPIAAASNDLTRDFYVWMGIAAGASDGVCVQASYLDLSRNVAGLQTSVALWQKGDEASLKIAQASMERVNTALAHPVWPSTMATAIEKTKTAIAPMAKAIGDKNPAAADQASKLVGDGSHDITHAYYADWLPAAQLGSAEGQAASGQGGSMPSSHGHGSTSGSTDGPNYWFVGTALGLVLVTIVMVPFLRRRDLRAVPVEVE